MMQWEEFEEKRNLQALKLQRIHAEIYRKASYRKRSWRKWPVVLGDQEMIDFCASSILKLPELDCGGIVRDQATVPILQRLLSRCRDRGGETILAWWSCIASDDMHGAFRV